MWMTTPRRVLRRVAAAGPPWRLRVALARLSGSALGPACRRSGGKWSVSPDWHVAAALKSLPEDESTAPLRSFLEQRVDSLRREPPPPKEAPAPERPASQFPPVEELPLPLEKAANTPAARWGHTAMRASDRTLFLRAPRRRRARRRVSAQAAARRPRRADVEGGVARRAHHHCGRVLRRGRCAEPVRRARPRGSAGTSTRPPSSAARWWSSAAWSRRRTTSRRPWAATWCTPPPALHPLLAARRAGLWGRGQLPGAGVRPAHVPLAGARQLLARHCAVAVRQELFVYHVGERRWSCHPAARTRATLWSRAPRSRSATRARGRTCRTRSTAVSRCTRPLHTTQDGGEDLTAFCELDPVVLAPLADDDLPRADAIAACCVPLALPLRHCLCTGSRRGGLGDGPARVLHHSTRVPDANGVAPPLL